MHDDAHVPLMIAVPTVTQAAESVGEARRMFTRTLSCWASDVLVLRRCGAHQMAWPNTSSGFAPFQHSQVRKAA